MDKLSKKKAGGMRRDGLGWVVEEGKSCSGLEEAF
jgi:hypothetical protein